MSGCALAKPTLRSLAQYGTRTSPAVPKFRALAPRNLSRVLINSRRCPLRGRPPLTARARREPCPLCQSHPSLAEVIEESVQLNRLCTHSVQPPITLIPLTIEPQP